MRSLESLKNQVKQEENQIVAVANAADKELLLAIKAAVEEGLCSFILFGDEEAINDIASTIKLDLSMKAITLQHVNELEETANAAVRTVHQKEASILMKGNVATKSLLKAVLNKDYGLRSGKVLSHVALFEIPNQDRLIFLTDPAMNIAPNIEEKAEIIKNTVQVAHGVGIQLPKVAVIGPVETVNYAMQSTVDAAVLTQMQKRGQIKRCLIDGPLAFDNAVSLEAAKHKGIESEVAGAADIIMVPNIEVGNALYKSFIYFSNAKVAAIISGAKAPIILTSRADTAENKLNSLALALVSSKTFKTCGDKSSKK
ncbi:phosphate butyryltransferase [Virgibacillus profundi]|uniref:Phosphate butyryltransferase n=1 Tax=Virgibacillus profundi TaxID=2024555 RepID=A0A2A2IBL4_9BACI|nr:phosphate butyryltransferase [Virgibacillus profundi]PAV29119.1 phosphate butyryltransferase [Virgibacillus profundi]PXY53288.1 phosphate butyryltransferase [Virgibacillus profundi]